MDKRWISHHKRQFNVDFETAATEELLSIFSTKHSTSLCIDLEQKRKRSKASYNEKRDDQIICK